MLPSRSRHLLERSASERGPQRWASCARPRIAVPADVVRHLLRVARLPARHASGEHLLDVDAAHAHELARGLAHALGGYTQRAATRASVLPPIATTARLVLPALPTECRAALDSLCHKKPRYTTLSRFRISAMRSFACGSGAALCSLSHFAVRSTSAFVAAMIGFSFGGYTSAQQ